MLRPLLVFFCVLICGLSILQACSQIRIRKEIRDWTPDELGRLHRVLRTLNERPRAGALSILDQLTKIHLDWVPIAHGTPAFLPWHRYYIWYFETLIQKVDPTLTLPYWDWSLDSQHPERSIVFTEAYFGGNGVGQDKCVRDGPYANWQVNLPTPHCLTRAFDGGSKLGVFSAPEVISLLISQSTQYDAFRQSLEATPHASPHLNIAGDMSTMHSPNDPLFWLHHGYVDKLWSSYQNKGVAFQQQYGSLRDPNVTMESILLPFNIPIRSVLHTEALCYRYQEPSFLHPTTPDSGLRARDLQALSLQDDPRPSNASSSCSTTADLFHQDERGHVHPNVLPPYPLPDFVFNERSIQTFTKSLTQPMDLSLPNALQLYLNMSMCDKEEVLARNPDSLDRQHPGKLAIPKSLSPAWCHHMGLNMTLILHMEHLEAHVYDTLNHLDAFISLAAIEMEAPLSKPCDTR